MISCLFPCRCVCVVTAAPGARPAPLQPPRLLPAVFLERLDTDPRPGGENVMHVILTIDIKNYTLFLEICHESCGEHSGWLNWIYLDDEGGYPTYTVLFLLDASRA